MGQVARNPRFLSLGLTLAGLSCCACSRPELQVTLVPVADEPAIVGKIPLLVEPGGLGLEVAANEPASIRTVERGKTYAVSVGKGFIAAPATVAIGEDGKAAVRVPVLALSQQTQPGHDPGTRSATVEIEAWRPGKVVVHWLRGESLCESNELGWEAELPAILEDGWRRHGQHLEDRDAERDLARVLVRDDTSPERILKVVRELGEVRRKSLGSGARMTVGAFRVRVDQAPATERPPRQRGCVIH